MANGNISIKAQWAAPLWQYSQYEINKKPKTEEKTKAVGMSTDAHRMREKNLVWARASRVNLHG